MTLRLARPWRPGSPEPRGGALLLWRARRALGLRRTVAGSPLAALAAVALLALWPRSASAPIPLSSSPLAIAAGPVGCLDVATADSRVWALCAGNSHPLGEIADDGQPTALAADPTTGRVYVATADAIIALAGGTAPWQVALPPGQESVALALDAPAGRLYVASDSLVHGESTGGSLITLDARTGDIVATVPAGTARTALAIDPHRHRVYLADAADGIVLALAGDHLAVVAATFVGGTPTHLAIDAKRGRVYSADFATGRLTVISEATDGVVASVPLGRGPGDIAADPASGHVFVAAGTTGTVTILDRSLVPLATLHAGAMPAALVADPNGGGINVIDFGNLGIWRIDDGRIGGPTASPVAIVKDIATGKQAPAQSEGD